MKKWYQKLTHPWAKSAAGFTLVEMLVVIAIMGVLGGVGAVGYNGYVKNAAEKADQQIIAAVNTAFATACTEQNVKLEKVTAANISLKNNTMYGVSSVTVDGVTGDAAKKLTTAVHNGFKLYYKGNETAVFENEGGVQVNSLIWNDAKDTFEKSSLTVDTLIILSSGKELNVSGEDMDKILNSTYADMTYDDIAAMFDNVGASGETFAGMVRTFRMQDKLTAVLLANGLVADAAAAEALSTQQTANGLQMVTAKYLAGSGDIDELLTSVDLGDNSYGLLGSMASGTGGTKIVSAIAAQYAMVESFANTPEMLDKQITINTPTKIVMNYPYRYKDVTMTVRDYLASDYAKLDPIATVKAVQDTADYQAYASGDQYTKDKAGLVATLSILGNNTGTVSKPGSIDIQGYLDNGIRSNDAKDALGAVLAG